MRVGQHTERDEEKGGERGRERAYKETGEKKRRRAKESEGELSRRRMETHIREREREGGRTDNQTHAGPRSNSLREFEFILLGGNDHIGGHYAVA